jgi:hypothetical protein
MIPGSFGGVSLQDGCVNSPVNVAVQRPHTRVACLEPADAQAQTTPNAASASTALQCNSKVTTADPGPYR